MLYSFGVNDPLESTYLAFSLFTIYSSSPSLIRNQTKHTSASLRLPAKNPRTFLSEDRLSTEFNKSVQIFLVLSISTSAVIFLNYFFKCVPLHFQRIFLFFDSKI